jgi:hypothetical protein
MYAILFFFDKEHILISRRYQLHSASATTSCPNDIKDARNQKKRRITKKKSRYGDRKLETATLAPPRQHQNISFSTSEASKKETVHKR